MKNTFFQFLVLLIICFNLFENKTDFDYYDDEITNFIQENFQSEDIIDFLEYVMNFPISENEAEELKNNLIKIVERYIYLDIIKNPPQPKDNYYNIVDLVEELKNVNTKDTSIYNFTKDINLIISSCQDLHFTFRCNKEINGYTLNQMFFISPIHYKVTKNGVYNEPSSLAGLFDKDIIEQIKKNKDKQIEKINDLAPLEFIQNANKGFSQLKSPQAQFVYNSQAMEQYSLGAFQLEKEDLVNITILYKDGNILMYNYSVGFATKTNELFFDYFTAQYDTNPERFKEISDITKSYMIKNNLLRQSNQITWDKEIYNKYRDSIKCRVDKKYSINVIYQNSFLFDDYISASNLLIGCFRLFYTNDYPIVIIEDNNGGGSTFVCDYFIALVNLNKPLIEYSSFRNNDDVKKNIASKQSYLTLDTCEYKTGDYFFDKYEIDDYGIDEQGNNIEHNRTQLFSATGTNRSIIENNKKILQTDIRKPTEIIIFTDGYSFSATSDFIKTTYLAGGAIIVGYNGNPNFETFDSSQNPASVLSTSDLKTIDALSKKIEDLQFTVRFTYKEYFDINYEGNPQIPLEFQIHEIDERFDFYEKYSEEHYNDFLEEAKYIFEKYKTECNPKNKRLLNITDDCVFADKNMHGGYECGSNGEWTTTCVPSYCNNGLIYDKKTNKCINDICLNKGGGGGGNGGNNNDDNNRPVELENSVEGTNLFISSMVFFGVSAILIILYVILCCTDCEKSIYLLIITIPFLIVAIILILISTLKFDYKV